GHDLARNRAGSDPRRGLARGRASATAIVVDAVLVVAGVPGMSRTIGILDRRVIFRTLIDIVDEERDRRAGRHFLPTLFVGERARENTHGVGLLALRGEARLAGPAAIEILLDVSGGQRDA